MDAWSPNEGVESDREPQVTENEFDEDDGIAGNVLEVEEPREYEPENEPSPWLQFQNFCFTVTDTVADAADRFNRCCNHQSNTALRFGT
jgi:hypothetical protein